MTKTVRGDSPQGSGGVATGADECCQESSDAAGEPPPRCVENAVDERKLATGELPTSLPLPSLPAKPPPTSAGRLEGKGVYPASSSQSKVSSADPEAEEAPEAEEEAEAGPWSVG